MFVGQRLRKKVGIFKQANNRKVANAKVVKELLGTRAHVNFTWMESMKFPKFWCYAGWQTSQRGSGIEHCTEQNKLVKKSV